MKTFTIYFPEKLFSRITSLFVSFLILSATYSPVFGQTAAKSILFEQSSEFAEIEQGSSQSLLEYIATSDNNPVSAQLKAADDVGNIPTWLTVNGNIPKWN